MKTIICFACAIVHNKLTLQHIVKVQFSAVQCYFTVIDYVSYFWQIFLFFYEHVNILII